MSTHHCRRMVARLSTASLVMCALPHSVLIKTTASHTVLDRPLVRLRVASYAFTTQATNGIKPVFTPFFNVFSCRSRLRPPPHLICVHHSTAAPGTTPPSWSYYHRGNTPTSWSKLTSRGLCLLPCPSSALLRPGSSHLE